MPFFGRQNRVFSVISDLISKKYFVVVFLLIGNQTSRNQLKIDGRRYTIKIGETVTLGDIFTPQYKWSMEKQKFGFYNVVSEQLKKSAFSFINIFNINNNYNFVLSYTLFKSLSKEQSYNCPNTLVFVM